MKMKERYIKQKYKRIPKQTSKRVLYEVIVELYEKKGDYPFEKGKYIGRELVFLSSTINKMAINKARSLNTLSIFQDNVIASPILDTLKLTKHIAVKDMMHRKLNDKSKSRKKGIVKPIEEFIKKEQPKSKPKIERKETETKESVLSKAEKEKAERKKRFDELHAIAVESVRLYELSKISKTEFR